MAKRKLVGGYAFSDDEDDEPSPAPTHKKPYRPLMLSAPAFKLPISSRVQSNAARAQPQLAASSAATLRTPGQTVATSSGTRTSLSTSRDTPDAAARVSADDSEPLNELDKSKRGPSTPIGHSHPKGKEHEAQAGPSTQHLPGRLTYERQLHELERSAAGCAAVATEQARENEYLRGQVDDLKEKLGKLTKDFDEYRQAQAMRWMQAKIAAQVVPAAPVAPVAPTAPAAPGNPSNYGTPEAAMTSGIEFDPRQDTSSSVAVSKVGVLSDILATFQHRSASDKLKISDANLVQLLSLV
ncbi:hypothetical protein FRC10_009059 [Ceratobasidium sp. 414]|nr:hypothetical protein FRC10_009059 [Ceratobasidium sp. 414]